jgi:hypothetical protein
MDPVKVAGVADWPTPTNKTEVKAGHESWKLMGTHELIRGKTRGYSHPRI